MAKIAGLQGTDVLNEPRGAALNTNTLHQLQEDVIIAALRRPTLGSTIKGAGVSERHFPIELRPAFEINWLGSNPAVRISFDNRLSMYVERGDVVLKPASSDAWSIGDWRTLFAERAAVAEFDGGLPRPDAEAQAFACCVVEWLNRNPARSPPGRCRCRFQEGEWNGCNGKEEPGANKGSFTQLGASRTRRL